jgi:CheY-like chemotaxis protein
MDTGVGMSPELVNNLFRVDVKTRSSRGTANEPGTGLGLVLCKEFIEKNGGSIGVESEPGKGSSFWFSLPLAREAAVPDVAALRELARGLRVLVVEDDKLHKEAGAKTLQDVGISPQFAADGEEAVRLAGAGGFDLILMDIDLPLLDGIEAARRIRAAGGEQSRIVCLSSYTQSELGARAEAARFDGYLDKPLTRTALCRLLERLFITPAA